MTTSIAQRRLITTDAAFAARALDAGAIVAHGFANIYAITARADEHTVRRINLMKGSPPNRVGNITAPPATIRHVWDFGELPTGLNRRRVLKLIDTFFALGPFGFRGPAAAHLPAHLTCTDGPVSTTQLIGPGYACPANDFLAASLRATGDEFLAIASANRSRHTTGAADSPAHWRTDGLSAEFGDEPGVLIVEHADEAAALSRYPRFQPMSPTILGFHRVEQVAGDRRPNLILERHGSLAVDDVRSLLDDLGYGLVLGPGARTRPQPRDYALGLSDR
jgi:tRNA A37 threonylcarbamoyladenosine synthetase subunit TsaC/SUA5/YrdC